VLKLLKEHCLIESDIFKVNFGYSGHGGNNGYMLLGPITNDWLSFKEFINTISENT